MFIRIFLSCPVTVLGPSPICWKTACFGMASILLVCPTSQLKKLCPYLCLEGIGGLVETCFCLDLLLIRLLLRSGGSVDPPPE